MLKWLASLAIIISAIVSVAYEQHYAREKYQAKAQAACIELSISIEEKHTCTKEAQNRKDYSPWWYILTAWPEGITTWAIVATGFIIAWQSSETRKAAQATRDSVGVAKNAERAWITVAPGLLSPKLYPPWEQGTTYPTDPETLKMVRHQLPLLIKNVGKTPAKMDEFACRYIRVSSMEELPAEPDYGLVQPQGGHWIIPGDTHNAPVDLETDNGILCERHVIDIRRRQSFLIAFGIVKYRDVHGERHKTQFCFVYTFPIPGIMDADGNEIPARIFKTGPEKYNYAD
jgi:hypothetical protein